MHFFSKVFTRNLRKRRLLLLMAIVLMLQGPGGVVSLAAESDTEKLDATIQSTAEYVSSISDHPSAWNVITRAKAGLQVQTGYLEQQQVEIIEKQGEFRRITDAQKMALGVAAAGGDPENVAGYNLMDIIFNHAGMTNQGANGPIYALMVIGSGSYAISEDVIWHQEKLLNWLLDAQLDNGSWSLTTDGAGSIDITAMAVTALASFVAESEVQAAIDQAVSWLSSQQLASGGFHQDAENSESAAQVIIALTSAGVDPTGEDFTKSDGNLLDFVLSFHNEDGGFAHLSGQSSNAMSSEQAFQALVAYQLYLHGQGGLYQNLSGSAQVSSIEVSLQVEGPQQAVASGTIETEADHALDALTAFLDEQGISYHVEDASFGKYVSAIAGLEAGMYGGWDGWGFSVKREGEWVFPQVGMGDFDLEDGDEVVVYYGAGTALIESVKVNPQQPAPGEPFTVTVHKASWDWESQKKNVSPAVGVAVEVNGQSALTDENGQVTLKQISAGTHELTVSGYTEDTAPSIVRYSSQLTVGFPLIEQYSDKAAVSGWAYDEVAEAIRLGLFRGVSLQVPTFAPQATLTRQQWIILLTRIADVSWQAAEEVVYNESALVADEPVTRAEMAASLAVILQLPEAIETDGFSDSSQFSAEHAPYIYAVAEQDLIVGHGDVFAPKDSVTREMAAAVAVRVFHYISELE